ncbi:MAG TPA: polyketide synthase dehydratase domain-containing protein, partial [Methylomirabilota bacterium]|nr:polyketide synthase dehydratase domain-containing protein [Methylomirabilota bacterium]
AGVFVRWLKIPYAFHSRAMDPIHEAMLTELAGLEPRSSMIPFVSTVTGRPLDTKWLDADYWWDNVRRPVLLAPAVDGLLRAGDHAFLEIGPHPALESSLKESLAERGRMGAVLHSLRRETDESLEMLTACASLHVLGVPIDWRAVNQSDAPHLRLPAYPWGRESFWLESRSSAQQRLVAFVHPLLGQRVEAALPTWQHALDLRRLPYLGDHRIWDGVVLPASAYVEMAAAVARLLFPHERYAVEDLEISRALFIDPAAPPAIQVVFDPDDASVRIYGAPAARDAWELHAEATLRRLAPGSPGAVDLDVVRGRLVDHFAHERVYAELAVRGYDFGPAFRQMRQMWRAPGEALTEIAVDEAFRAGEYGLHPVLLDACLQAVLGTRLAAAHTRPEDDLLLPNSIGCVRLHAERVPARLWAHARLTAAEARSLQADIAVYDDDGRRVADVLGVLLVRAETRRAGADLEENWYRFEWEPRDLDGAAAASPSPAAPPAAVKRYALLADMLGVAERLAQRLEALGHQTLVLQSDAAQDVDADGVIHCWSLDQPAAGDMDLDALRGAQQRGVLSAFRLIRALGDRPTPVWFVTRNAQGVLPGDRVEGLAAASLVGLLRVAANERQGRVLLIDLDACSPDEAAAHLTAEVTLPADGEMEVAYRDGTRHALRMRPTRPDELPRRVADAVRSDGSVTPYRLQIDKPGVLTNLALHETPRPAPRPHEIEI